MDKKILVVILVVVVAVVCFYAGVKYQGSKTPDLEAMISARFSQGESAGDHTAGIRAGRFGGMAAGDFTGGKIISKDDQSIIVELTDTDGVSGSKIVFFSDSTGISKTDEGTTEDLAVGMQVMVVGSTNEDGSITAETIQIRPDVLRVGDRLTN